MPDFPPKIYSYIWQYKMALQGWDEPQSVKETLEYLIAITEQKEKDIEEEHKKKYWTDDTENEFKNFVVLCMQRILVHYEEIDQECSVQLMALLKHRHWGYGFFTAYELMRNGDSVEQIETVTKTFLKIKAEQIDYKIIYLSFIHYCSEFYGKFSDNECSIVMICQYYSPEIRLNEEEKDYIIEALYMHISNAGTPADLGYAFNLDYSRHSRVSG